MLDEDYQPKLLELTFSPDCERILKTYPTFLNEAFECLFLHRDCERIDRIL
jgi:tubulin--tyrosine ligase-like protein 12